MHRGWFGGAIVLCLAGCGDDEPSWVPPEEEAGALETNQELVPDSGIVSAQSSVGATTTVDTTVDTTSNTTADTASSTSSDDGTRSSRSDWDAGVSQAASSASYSSDAERDASVTDAATTTSDDAATDVTAQSTTTASDAGSVTVATETQATSTLSDTTTTQTLTSNTTADTTVSNGTTSDTVASTSDVETGIQPDAGSSDTATDATELPPDGGTPDAGPSEPIEARAGFIDIEGVDYALMGSSRQTSSARTFYAFTPADDLPEEAPVFVFFNGGPGSATSAGLLSYGTGHYSLPSDLSGPNLTVNPSSWAQMGNLLYFDTRQAGFSYSTLPDPSDEAARAAEWNERNYNLYVDAADSIRLVLRVLTAQPALRDNPIVLVGESYGGTRATMMLRFLLEPELLRSPNLYQDISLADEITSFFEANLDAEVDTVEAQAKRQLPAQVLIQPFFAANQFPDQDAIRCLPDTPAQQVAAELSTSCESIELYRDTYKINEPATWSESLDLMAQQMLTDATKLPTLLGVELNTISGLAAPDRTLAYREPQSGWYTDPQPEFVTALGQLQPWDAYHLTLTPRAPWSDSIYDDPYPCYFFSWVAQQVDTFITNAKWDNIVLTPVLPTTLFDCSQLDTTPFVDGIAFAPEGLAMGESGQMVFQFNDLAPEGAAQTAVEIRGYESGHMVTVTHAAPLFGDVQAFLVERGVL